MSKSIAFGKTDSSMLTASGGQSRIGNAYPATRADLLRRLKVRQA
jgi:hypothetical protein